MKNKIALFFCLAFFTFSSFSQQIRPLAKGEEDWRYLNQAKTLFEEGDFGSSLSMAQKAKQQRNQEYEWQNYVIENLQKNSNVRKAEDKLNLVYEEVLLLKNKNAISIFEQMFSRHGKEYFGNSLEKFMDVLEYDKNYPEADYLIGKIFAIEGELESAYTFFNKSYENASRFDVPEMKYDVLYDLALLSSDMQKDNDYEKYLLLILMDDPFYKDNNYMSLIMSTIGKDEKESPDKLFSLFRDENVLALKACNGLSKFYMKKGQTEKALKCSALGSIIAYTRIFSYLKENITGYVPTSFSDILEKSAKFEDVIKWGNDNEAWEVFYNLGLSSSMSGKLFFAKSVWTVMAYKCPEEYWKLSADNALIK